MWNLWPVKHNAWIPSRSCISHKPLRLLRRPHNGHIKSWLTRALDHWWLPTHTARGRVWRGSGGLWDRGRGCEMGRGAVRDSRGRDSGSVSLCGSCTVGTCPWQIRAFISRLTTHWQMSDIEGSCTFSTYEASMDYIHVHGQYKYHNRRCK